MLLLTRDNHSYIMFSCPDGKDSGLHFHNTTDSSFVGRIAYDHNSSGDNMLFTVNSSERMRIDSAGAIKFNTYTLTQQTGTSAYLLGVDASGNVVQSTNIPAGTGGSAGPYLPLAGGTMTGDISMSNGERIRWNADNPSGGLSIHSNASNSFIEHTGTGYFSISNDCTGGVQTDINITNYARNQTIRFRADNGNPEGTTSCEIRDYFFLDGSAATYSSGASTAVYTVFPDLSYLVLGTGRDLQIYHDGTHSLIKNTTGNLYILDDGYIEIGNGAELSAGFVINGAVNLYYDNSLKLATFSGGARVYSSLKISTGSTDYFEVFSYNGSPFLNGSGTGVTMTIGAPTGGYTQNLQVMGTIIANSTVTATNFILSSDRKLKEKIKEIDNQHVSVNWKNFELKSEPGVKRAGVIAQELEEKHPEFVRTDDKGLKSVAYIDLLITKIAELEARLEKAGI